MMVETGRKRSDPRREATRLALLEAAERLFGEFGTGSVSTRQVGAAVGSLNTNVVAYHFGSKAALIEALFHFRLPEIDRRRGEMLVAMDAGQGAPTVAALMHAFALPLYEQTDALGQHSFVRFLSGLERSGMSAARGLVMDDYPHSKRLTALLVACLPPETIAEGHLRLRLVRSLLATAMQIIDRSPDLAPQAARRLFENVEAMAVAAFAAPAAQGTRE